MSNNTSDMDRTLKRGAASRRERTRQRPAENRSSIGFALHNRFPQDEQPSLAAFSQVMAHRIRGLLTGIEGFTDLLLESVEESDQRELAFRILESTSRIEGILADLQHYNDPLEAHFHRVPAATVAPESMNALSDREFDRVSVTNGLPAESIIRADESLIRQALLSLIRNALEADGEGTEPVSLESRVDEDGSSIEFRIRNHGSRLSHDSPEPVFQAFYTTKSANLGLGLTLARRIARIHRGDLVVSSRSEDPFTEFTLRIPILTEQAATA